MFQSSLKTKIDSGKGNYQKVQSLFKQLFFWVANFFSNFFFGKNNIHSKKIKIIWDSFIYIYIYIRCI